MRAPPSKLVKLAPKAPLENIWDFSAKKRKVDTIKLYQRGEPLEKFGNQS